MQIFKKILCPVDFSDYSQLALRYASALSAEYEADLVIYHSVPDIVQVLSYLEGNYTTTVTDMLISSAEEKLGKFAEKIVSPDRHSVQRIGTGNPSEEILEVAQEQEVDLIVMGTHGHTGYDRFLLGSVTNRVLHKSIIPVLVVCKPSHHFIKENPERPVEIKRILCALDFEKSSAGIRDFALSIGRSYQSEIYFFHAVPANGPDLKAMAMQTLRELVHPELENWCKLRLLIETGDPAEEVLRAIEHHEIDLVVMGHHTRKPIEELFLGSVTKRVVPDSACPVLVLRSRADLVSS